MHFTTITTILLQLKLVWSLKCFYCQLQSQHIAPQLWLHTVEQCSRRRVTECESSSKACVVVSVHHAYANFTVSGCSEDDFVGCEEYNVPTEYGRTNVQVCQCTEDRCNSDFHLDFGKDFNRMNGNKSGQRTLTKFLGIEEQNSEEREKGTEGRSRQDRQQISLKYQEVSTPALQNSSTLLQYTAISTIFICYILIRFLL
ncbi:unnamed protein product [Bursaphelenchus okinawaensis]|uniref:Protein quiver n=1 Tax=Bursaphelenchus okinawaensis TaxID=465554 RepID=A0A811JX44_9BILA|nr:unnamed protein product [Bursaphelenchus okinawaensis]CAG9086783.1 unnamed protein product [Bursaphelenchus okinawaensis]